MCNDDSCSGENPENFQSTGGRVDNAAFTSVTGSLTVGYYDHTYVPAVNIFGGVGCTGASARLYSSADADVRTVEYGKRRVEVGPGKFATSAMVPHGYTLSVYA